MATPSQPPGTVVVNTRVREHRGAKENRQQGAKQTSIKAVLLGDYGTGKTTLFKRIREEELLLLSNRSSSWSSQSMDLCNLSINTADKKKVQLHLWDTAGAERYRTLTLDFFRKALIIFLVYRTDRLISLTNLQYWKGEAQTYAPPKATYVLVGNVFTDDNMEVSTETASEFAARHEISTHIRLSATTTSHSNVMEMLANVVEKVINFSDTVQPNTGVVVLSDQQPKPKPSTHNEPESQESSKWCWCT